MLTMNNEETRLRDGCATTAEDAPASESRLIERVQRGDNEAFYELVRPCERGVYLAAVSIVRNASDAEEVAQEAILKGFMEGLPKKSLTSQPSSARPQR